MCWPAKRPFTVASNASATRTLSISSKPSPPSPPSRCKDGLYCGLILAWDYAARPAICSNTVFQFDQGPARKLHSNSCHHAFVQHPSACRLQLLSIYTSVHSPADDGIQGIMPSVTTLFFRSTRNQRGICDPIIIATVQLQRTLQPAVFDG
jgi:hypothetical protein